MFKSLVIIVITGGVSFILTDIESESAFRSVVSPLVAVLSAMALAVWLVLLFHKDGIDRRTTGRGADGGGAPVAPDDFGGFGGGSDSSG